jgi:hypothetical protein
MDPETPREEEACSVVVIHRLESAPRIPPVERESVRLEVMESIQPVPPRSRSVRPIPR